MNLGMQVQVLTPGVQHTEEADLGAEVPGIGRNRQQAFRRGLEEHAVDPALILQGQRADLVRP